MLYLLHNAHPFHTGGYAVRAHGILRAVRSWGFDAQAVMRPGYPWDRVREAGTVEPTLRIDEVPYHYPDRGLPALDWATPHRYLDAYAEYLIRRCGSCAPP